MKNGIVGTGDWSHARWCKVCNRYHGILYLCEKYPEKIKEKIKHQNDKHMENLRNPKWCQKQIDQGLPPEGIVIFRALANLREDDWEEKG